MAIALQRVKERVEAAGNEENWYYFSDLIFVSALRASFPLSPVMVVMVVVMMVVMVVVR